jgi:4-carboxymuconolactone decarboxylase
MSDQRLSGRERRERGVEKIREVYAGDVKTPPAGASQFADLMLEQLFAEVWTREALSMRDRRMLLLGAIAALGERDTFGIQVRAALKNDELTPEQVREVLIFLVHYVGYPRAAGLLGTLEQAIQEAEVSAG